MRIDCDFRTGEVKKPAGNWGYNEELLEPVYNSSGIEMYYLYQFPSLEEKIYIGKFTGPEGKDFEIDMRYMKCVPGIQKMIKNMTKEEREECE